MAIKDNQATSFIALQNVIGDGVFSKKFFGFLDFVSESFTTVFSYEDSLGDNDGCWLFGCWFHRIELFLLQLFRKTSFFEDFIDLRQFLSKRLTTILTFQHSIWDNSNGVTFHSFHDSSFLLKCTLYFLPIRYSS